jgi:hypothetical protein
MFIRLKDCFRSPFSADSFAFVVRCVRVAARKLVDHVARDVLSERTAGTSARPGQFGKATQCGTPAAGRECDDRYGCRHSPVTAFLAAARTFTDLDLSAVRQRDPTGSRPHGSPLGASNNDLIQVAQHHKPQRQRSRGGAGDSTHDPQRRC